jgi:hypothetical protein
MISCYYLLNVIINGEFCDLPAEEDRLFYFSWVFNFLI